ncbi:MAG: hypothetical protein GX639_19830 [Fibrobacter sp.]|nr:hypothetical protein [Fibrobacter sp.]
MTQRSALTEPVPGTKSGLLCMMPTVGSREIENPQVFAGDPIYLLIAMRGAPKKTGTMKFIIPDN